jgi:hypothetical protein
VDRQHTLKRFDDELWRKLEASKGATDDLDPLEYAAVCLMNFQSEVYNGGLHTYFYNSSGNFAKDTPEVLRQIGAPQLAQILEEANTLFGETGPDRDIEKRRGQLESLGTDAEERLEDLTHKVYAAEDAGLRLGDLFDEYVVSQRAESSPK